MLKIALILALSLAGFICHAQIRRIRSGLLGKFGYQPEWYGITFRDFPGIVPPRPPGKTMDFTFYSNLQWLISFLPRVFIIEYLVL